MNKIIGVILCVSVACSSAGHLGYGYDGGYLGAGHGGYAGAGYVGTYAPNPAAHIPSGSVSASADGAVVAGPAGSVSTDNGLHTGVASSMVAGPAGDIRTKGGHTTITGPGLNAHDGHAAAIYGGGGAGYGGGYVSAGPAVVAAPAVVASPVHPSISVWGPAAGLVGGGFGHGGGFAGGHGLFGHGHGW